MTDDRWTAGHPEPWADLLADDVTWAPVPDVEDAVLAAVADQRARSAETVPSQQPARTTRGLRRSPTRRPAALGALAGAAAAVVALLALTLTTDVVRLDLPGGAEPEQIAVALTDPGPRTDPGAPAAAMGEALLEDRSDGLWIALHVDGVPPAPAGQWYEATVGPAGGPALPAGSFHLRGGGGRVILWAAAELTPDLEVVVSRQPQGVPVLSGQLAAPTGG